MGNSFLNLTNVNYRKLQGAGNYTANQLKQLDKNNDGAISKDEFNYSYNAATPEMLEKTYKEFQDSCGINESKSKINDDGTSTVVQNITNEDGTKSTVTSQFDANGTMTSYSVKVKNSDSSTTTTSYKVSAGGCETEAKVTTKKADGSKTIVNKETGNTKTVAADGSSTVKNSEGKITSVKSADGKQSYKFTYDDDGNIKTVTVNGKKYKGKNVQYDEKTGKYVIKNKNGKKIAAVTKDANGNTKINQFKDGKKSIGLTVNSDGEMTSTRKYNSDGTVKYRNFCATGIKREYEYNDKKTRTSSTDYKNGKKVKSNTWKAQKDEDGKTTYQKSSQTEYKKNGKVASYKTFDYKTAPDGSTTTTTTEYAKKGGKLKGKTLTTKDSEGRKTSKIEYDSNNSLSKSKEWIYSEHGVDKLSKVITQEKGKTTSDLYDIRGKLLTRTISHTENGTTVIDHEYEYSYDLDGKRSRTEKPQASAAISVNSKGASAQQELANDQLEAQKEAEERAEAYQDAQDRVEEAQEELQQARGLEEETKASAELEEAEDDLEDAEAEFDK